MSPATSRGDTPRCSAHPRTRAAWRCGSCDRRLCPDCAAPDARGNTKLVRCAHCGGFAEPLRVARRLRPWPAVLPTLAASLLSVRGLLHLLALGAVLQLVGFVGMFPFIGFWLALALTAGIYGGYLFGVIQHTATGARELPPASRLSSGAGDVLGAAARLLAAGAPILIPALLFFTSDRIQLMFISGSLDLWREPVWWLLLIGGVAYLPAAFMVAATAGSFGEAVNPLSVVAVIQRVGGSYLGLALFAGALFAANQLLEQALASLAGPIYLCQLSSAFLKLWLVRSGTLVLPVLTAMALGRFLYQHGRSLGLLSERDLLVEAMPDAVPRAAPPADDRQAQATEAPAAAAPGPPAALELESTPAEALAGAVKLGNGPMALDAYRRLSAAGQVPQLDPEGDLWLAGELERAGEAMAAVHACRRAAQADLKGPLAPRALFEAARLLDEKLAAPGDAQALWRFLIQHHPDHPLAAEARQRLGA